MQDWTTWSYWVDGALDSLHFVCALGALILGPIVLMRTKGDKTHRWLGRIWTVMMGVIVISALSMYKMNGRPNLFHVFAIISLITLTSAIGAIWRYRRTRKREYLVTHQHCMVWANFGLFMAGLWQVVFNLVRSDVLTISIALLYNGLGAFTGVTAFALFFLLAKKYPTKPGSAR